MFMKLQNYIGFILIFSILSAIGCATAPRQFDPNIKDAQMFVEPGTVRVGVAKIMGTDVIFKGKGFQPKDSVFIKLLGVQKQDQVIDIPIADGNVDENGIFTAKLEKLVKITEFLRANVALNDVMETIVVISQPPIPANRYRLRAESMESIIKAECDFVIKKPSVVDRLKDWLGVRLGKIRKE